MNESKNFVESSSGVFKNCKNGIFETSRFNASGNSSINVEIFHNINLAKNEILRIINY